MFLKLLLGQFLKNYLMSKVRETIFFYKQAHFGVQMEIAFYTTFK